MKFKFQNKKYFYEEKHVILRSKAIFTRQSHDIMKKDQSLHSTNPQESLFYERRKRSYIITVVTIKF